MIYVIVLEPISIYTDWAHQNDRQNLSFMKYINVVSKKMTGNSLKMPNCWGCLIHFQSEFMFHENGSQRDLYILSLSVTALSVDCITYAGAHLHEKGVYK